MEKNTNSTSAEQLAYQREKRKEEMKQQVITFALMIIFTVIAFAMVAGDMSKLYVVPVIFLLAIVQVIFQLYYFMHMNHKGHGMVSLFIYSGIFAAMLTVAGVWLLVWW